MLFHNHGGTHYSPAEFNRDRGLSPSATGLAAQLGPAAVRQTQAGVLSGISLFDRLRTGVMSTNIAPVLDPTPVKTLVKTAYYEPEASVAIAPPIPIPEGVPAPPVSPGAVAAKWAPAMTTDAADLVKQSLQTSYQPSPAILPMPPAILPMPVSLLPEEEPGFLDKKIFGKVKVKYALIGGALSIAGIFAVRALR